MIKKRSRLHARITHGSIEIIKKHGEPIPSRTILQSLAKYVGERDLPKSANSLAQILRYEDGKGLTLHRNNRRQYLWGINELEDD